MTPNLEERNLMASLALDLVPPLVQSALLDDKNFRIEVGVNTDANIGFGGAGLAFRRSVFFNAVRAALSNSESVNVTDTEGGEFILLRVANDGGVGDLILSSDQRNFVVNEFFLLAEDSVTRLYQFGKCVSEINLPIESHNRWFNILNSRPLEDDEFDLFHNDIYETPGHVQKCIRRDILSGSGSMASLVPNSRRYFARLIGDYGGEKSIQDYAKGGARELFKKLREWHAYDGFLFSLLLSSHTSLSAEIDLNQLSSDELFGMFAYIGDHGDLISKLGVIELSIRLTHRTPEIESYLTRFVEQVLSDDIQATMSEFRLLSSLFILVDGELGRIHLLNSCPPFYRRLASLAQAALIHRELVSSGVDYDRFCELALSGRGQCFYFQNLADIRHEPRWHPDLADPTQFQAEFYGRILIAINNSEFAVTSSGLLEVVHERVAQSDGEWHKFPRPYYSGPLEGAECSLNEIPSDLAQVITEQLRRSSLDASSFIALVNSVMIFKIESGYADLAAEALKVGSYKVANLDDKSQLLAILNGLAMVAAVARSPKLADELRIFVRRYRHDPQYMLSVEEAVQIGLVACAAWHDLVPWRDAVGAWVTEMAFGDLKEGEGVALYSHLSAMLHSVPELWVSCSRAEAALRAWCSR